jgi:hypothetical protein
MTGALLFLFPALHFSLAETAPFAPVPDTYDYVLGTQNIGATYHFTDQTTLVEGARKIYEMGSNMLKIGLTPQYVNFGYASSKDLKITSLTELVRDEPSYRQVFNMPFAYYFMWTYCFHTYGRITPWNGPMAPDVLAKEYREIYDLTAFLLTTYNGSGKTFFLGNWEGDWHLLSGTPPDKKPKWERTARAEAVPGMIDWLNTRQKAVDDAKRDTPHHNVQVYHYLEVNLVQKGLKGERCVARDVLPHTHVDYVSYSSYDSLKGDVASDLAAALSYIESNLPPKDGIPNKRVFIGEYGYGSGSPADIDQRCRNVMKTALQWGCPFILYWELYDNELTKEGKQKAFCLIDSQNVKLPLYYTHQHFYEQAKEYVRDFKNKQGHPPDADAFHRQGGQILQGLPIMGSSAASNVP